MSTEDKAAEEEFDIVEVDELPAPGATPAAKEEDEPETEEPDADGEEPEEDERLAEKEGDDPEAKKSRRAKQREFQKRAKAENEAERRMLREANKRLEERLARIEGNQLSHVETTIDQRLTEVDREIARLESIQAAAIEQGNGQDATEAMRLRDSAVATKQELLGAKKTVTAQRTAAPAQDANAVSLANQWKAANPWYGNPQHVEDSDIVDAIDKRLMAEGRNPGDMGYWQEMTRRVAARLAPPAQQQQPGATSPAKKKGPPVGQTREHVPTSTKTEVYVSPARKQAMIENGSWDDPVRRKSTLKAYAEYDRNNASR